MLPIVEAANASHKHFAETICKAYKESAKARGTGISQRSEEFVEQKMADGDAIIATYDGEFAGFTYISTYEDRDYVAHSGLIVNPKFRGMGLAKKLKHSIFELTREKYPDASIFGIT
ncbi:MAG: GNAT family N-acetyltransferase, partial [Luteibaculum sp.]